MVLVKMPHIKPEKNNKNELQGYKNIEYKNDYDSNSNNKYDTEAPRRN